MVALFSQEIMLRNRIARIPQVGATAYGLGTLISAYQSYGRNVTSTCLKGVWPKMNRYSPDYRILFNHHQFAYMQMPVNIGMDHLPY